MPGGRPSKPLALVQGHRTKAEKEIRQKAENELLTGISLREMAEVKNNPVAHKEFVRLKKLLKAIGKDDDLSGHIINTHCLLVAECKELEDIKTQFLRTLETFEGRVSFEEISFSEEMKMRMSLQNQILATDKSLMAKRKLMLDISKESILTIASALRSIPKKPTDETSDDPMAQLLGGD